MTVSVGGFQGHLFHGEGISQDVLGEFFEFGLVFGWDGFARVEVEAGMFPGEISRTITPFAPLNFNMRKLLINSRGILRLMGRNKEAPEEPDTPAVQANQLAPAANSRPDREGRWEKARRMAPARSHYSIHQPTFTYRRTAKRCRNIKPSTPNATRLNTVGSGTTVPAKVTLSNRHVPPVP